MNKNKFIVMSCFRQSIQVNFQSSSSSRKPMSILWYGGFMLPEEIQFISCTFWVRVYKVPPRMIDERIGAAIGESLGKVLEVDVSDGRFIRLRVSMDVKKPLKNGTILTLPDAGGDMEVKFFYEKRPDVCWVCGMIDHLEDDCLVAAQMRKTMGFAERRFLETMMEDPNSVGSSGFEGKGSGGKRRTFMTPVSPKSRGGASVSTHRHANGRSSSRPVGSRGDRVSEYAPVMPSGASPRGVRYHVDSLILRGKAVARALEEASEADEVDSEFQGESVRKDVDGGGVAELPYEGFVVDHGLKESEVGMPHFVGEGAARMRTSGQDRGFEAESSKKMMEDFMPLKVGDESATPKGSRVPNVETDVVGASPLDAAKLASILG